MSSAPRLSVIIPVYQPATTLARVLESLRPQVGSQVEAVVVDSTGLDHAAGLERTYPWLRVVGLPSRALPGAARNAGARVAQGSQLAFLDADALPAKDWLSRLQARFDGAGLAAVAGAVHNGTP